MLFAVAIGIILAAPDDKNNEKPLNKALNLPLEKDELVGTLGRALNIAVGRQSTTRRRTRDKYGPAARELIRYLTQDQSEAPTSGSSQESGSPNKRPQADPDFCEPSTSFGSERRTSLETMKKIVDMSKSRSEAGIRRLYPWYRRQYLNDFTRCIEAGGSHSIIRNRINQRVQNDVNSILENQLPLKTYMIKGFGRRAARAENATWFKASYKWVNTFKKNNRLSSRKVTKKISRPRFENQEMIEESLLEFLNHYARISDHFDPRMIWNIDQSGIEYESSNERVVGRTGARDIYLRVDSMSKTTHTFTAQPIFTRDGRLTGPLTLCMQEATGDFGPIVRAEVRQQEQELGNVNIISSRSGKMTSSLMVDWIRRVLRPTMQRNLCRVADDEHCRIETRSNETDGKKLLLLADSWSGQTNQQVRLETPDVLTLVIPPHTTGDVQPLDVGFFRQLKIFIRRITEEALVLNRVADISSREGAINLMSVIYNQLQSPVYHDLWRYAWRNTDPHWSRDELSIFPPPNVNSVQFGPELQATCEVDGCTNDAVVRCSHDGTSLCLHHFLNRSHFHEIDDDGDRIALGLDIEPGLELEDDDDDEEELVRYVQDPYPLRNLSRVTTTTTPHPLGELVGPGIGLAPFQLGSIGRRKRRNEGVRFGIQTN